jgi:plastocyanin
MNSDRLGSLWSLSMKSTRVLAVTAALLLVSGARAAAPVTVTQKGLQFSVEELALEKGQTVVFSNNDRTAHNITVSGEGLNLNGGLQQPGGEFKVPFVKPGTYQVSCGIHPKMKMTIKVK